MNTQMLSQEPMNRRGFLRGSAALAACAMLPGSSLLQAAAKPNSVFNGVRVGVITYSYRTMAGKSAEDTLSYLLQNGLSEVELMGPTILDYIGIKSAPAAKGKGKGKAKPEEPAQKFTDAEREQQLAKCRDLRKMYNDAGVNIHIHKTAFGKSDEEIEFNFLMAKALGCVAITLERNEDMAKKLAPFADKHKIWVAFHNHTTNYPALDHNDPILDCGKYIGFNFDFGHYFAGSKGLSPIPVIEKYHDRILSLHAKDRTADNGNLPWGQGKTPLKEILQLIRKEKWTFPVDIELEYKVPDDSDAVKEVSKCVQFCREALA